MRITTQLEGSSKSKMLLHYFNLGKIKNNCRALLLVGSFGSTIVGCDIAHETVICNGFGEPITVIYENNAPPQTRSLSMEAGTCEKPSDATPMTEQVRSAVDGSLPDGVTVISGSGKVLAYFDFSSLYEKPRLHAPLQLMLVTEGIFQVPYEFHDNWFKSVERVKQASPRSWPNLKNKQGS